VRHVAWFLEAEKSTVSSTSRYIPSPIRKGQSAGAQAEGLIKPTGVSINRIRAVPGAAGGKIGVPTRIFRSRACGEGPRHPDSWSRS